MAIEKHHVKSKLAVAYQLMYSPDVSDHIPETELLRESSFRRMIIKHDKVYLKPDGGRKSRGVIRIEKLGNGSFRLRQGTDSEYLDEQELWTRVKGMIGDTKYIIQRAIDSVTIEGRHFDLRCHAVRVNGKWRVGGICGRLGERESVVTTSHYGGTPTLIETLFKRHLKYSDKEQSQMYRKVESCILKTVNRVSYMYPNLIEFAVDIGIDRKKRIWIYEVNIEPLIRGNFKLLPDKRLYQRIQKLRRMAR